jgi:hypothetical protein
MVEEQKPAGDIEELKSELASIKKEMMLKELEDIKLEKMREELEEMKAENAAEGSQNRYVYVKPKLSLVNTIAAVATLLVAGYILGTLYYYNLAGELNNYVVRYGLPISSTVLLTVVAVVLALIGLGLVTVARR